MYEFNEKKCEKIRKVLVMSKTNKLQSLACIMLIVLMVVGISQGTSIVGMFSTKDTGRKETVAQAASGEEEVRAVWISYLDFSSANTAKIKSV